ncbi:MAG: CmcI family methyltransferase [bacterium]
MATAQRHLTTDIRSLEQYCRDRELVTPEIHKVNDFYGHATQIKRYLGLPNPYPLKAMVAHSPMQIDYIWPLEANSPFNLMLTTHEHYAQLFSQNTGKKAIAIGSPLLYTAGFHHELPLPVERTLTAFPLHSTKQYDYLYSIDAFLDHLQGCETRFDSIRVCLYWKDVLRGDALKYSERGYEVVSAGHMFDLEFLPNLLKIIADSTETVSMFPGSNVHFAALLDRPTWLYELPYEQKSSDGNYAKMRAEKDSSPNEILETTRRLYAQSDRAITDSQREHSQRVMGVRHRKSREQMRDILMDAERDHAARSGIEMDQRIVASGMGETSKRVEHTYFEMIRNAMTAIQKQQPAQALELINNALDGGTRLKGMHLIKALALAGIGEYQQSRSAVDQELKQYPDNEDARLFLNRLDEMKLPTSNSAAMQSSRVTLAEARVVAEKGELEQALHLVSELKARRVQEQGIDELRGDLFLALGQKDAARESFREELRLFPGNTSSAEKLNRMLGNGSGRMVEASMGDSSFREVYRAVRPYTMLSEARLHSLYTNARRICEDNISGNFVECGVAGGGATALLAWVAKKFSTVPRWVYAFDSYEGMPAPGDFDTHQGQKAQDSGWGEGTCAAPIDSVREISRKLGVDDLVKPVKGYFEQTLPEWQNRVGMIALLHADGDWYGSTKSIFDSLYERISDDGIVQVDDYGHWEGARKAVDEFFSNRNAIPEVHKIDYTGVWFVKPERYAVNPRIDAALVEDFRRDDPASRGIISQMSRNERFQLYSAARTQIKPRKGVLRYIEIGSWEGASLRLIHAAMKTFNVPLQGLAIDFQLKPQLQQFLDQTRGEVHFLAGRSEDVAPHLAELFKKDGHRPPFIFIDGDHSYEGVRRDLLNYWPLLDVGGILVVHDYLPPLDECNREAILFHHAGNEPGIRRAVDEVIRDRFGGKEVEIPLLNPDDPTQTQAHLPIIPGLYSSLKAFRKTGE